MSKPIKLPPLPPVRLEIINLIDVLITLIAFFMLTSVFAEKSRRINVNLPAAPQSAATVLQNPKTKVEIVVSKENQLFFEGRRIVETDLHGLLKQYGNETVLIIKADQDCRYGLIVGLLDIVKSCHLNKIALEVKQ